MMTSTANTYAGQYTGTLRIRPIKANFSKSAIPKGKQSPYVILSIGNHCYRSQTDRHGGSDPVWNEYFVVRGIYSNQMIIQVVDHELFGSADYVMGEGIVDITSILAKPTSEYMISLSRGNYDVGTILMSFDSRPGDHVGMTSAEGLVLAELNKKSLKEKIMTKFGNVESYTYGVPDSMIQGYIRQSNAPLATSTIGGSVVTTTTTEQIIPNQSVIVNEIAPTQVYVGQANSQVVEQSYTEVYQPQVMEQSVAYVQSSQPLASSYVQNVQPTTFVEQSSYIPTSQFVGETTYLQQSQPTVQTVQQEYTQPIIKQQPGYLPTQVLGVGKSEMVEQPFTSTTTQVVQEPVVMPQNQIVTTTTTTEVITGVNAQSTFQEVYHQPRASQLTEVAVSQPILTGASTVYSDPKYYSLAPQQLVQVSENPQRLRSVVPTGVRHYQGALRVFPIEAVFDQDGPGGKRIDSYVVLRLGEYKYKTHAKKWGGRNPYWSEYFNITAVDKPVMDVFVYDRPKTIIGQSQLNLDNILTQPGYSEHWVELNMLGARVGQILLAFEPQPNMTNEQYLLENKQKTFFDRLKDKMSKTNITSIPLTNERYHDHHLVGNEQYQGAIRVIPVEAFLTQTSHRKIDPYIIMTCGHREYRSTVDKRGDHYPTWNEYFDLKGVVEKTIIVRIFDKDALTRDDFLAEGVVYIGDVIQSGVRTQNWVNLNKGGVDAGRLLVICEPKQYQDQELADSAIKTKTVKGQYLGTPTNISHDDYAVQHGGSLKIVPVEAIFNDFGQLTRSKPYVVIRFGSVTFKSHKTRGLENHFRWAEYFSLARIESNAMDVKVFNKKVLLGEGVFLLDEMVRTEQYTEYAFDLRSREGLNVGKIILGFEAKGYSTREEQGTEFTRKPILDRFKDAILVSRVTGIPLNNRTFDSMNLVSNSTVSTQPIIQNHTRSSGHLLITPLSYEFTWQNAGILITPYFLFNVDNKQHKVQWSSHAGRLDPFHMSNLNHDLMTVTAYDKELCEPSDFIGQGTTSLLNAFNSYDVAEQWVDLFINNTKVGRVLLAFRNVEIPTYNSQPYATYQTANGIDVGLTSSQYVFEPIRTDQTLATATQVPLQTTSTTVVTEQQGIYFEESSYSESISESDYGVQTIVQDVYPTQASQRIVQTVPIDFTTGYLRIKLLAGEINASTGRDKIKPYVIFKTSGQEFKSHADKKHNYRPVWTDYFDIENLSEDYVQLSVWDKEALHHDPLLGEGMFSMRSLLVGPESVEHSVPLTLNGVNVGRILLKLKYKSSLAVSRTASGISTTQVVTNGPTYYDKYEDANVPDEYHHENNEGYVRSVMEKLKDRIKTHNHHSEKRIQTIQQNETHIQKF